MTFSQTALLLLLAAPEIARAATPPLPRKAALSATRKISSSGPSEKFNFDTLDLRFQRDLVLKTSDYDQGSVVTVVFFNGEVKTFANQIEASNFLFPFIDTSGISYCMFRVDLISDFPGALKNNFRYPAYEVTSGQSVKLRRQSVSARLDAGSDDAQVTSASYSFETPLKLGRKDGKATSATLTDMTCAGPRQMSLSGPGLTQGDAQTILGAKITITAE